MKTDTQTNETVKSEPVKSLPESHLYNLEEIVDKLGVKGTLELLAQVCYEKSSHLYENWQDSDGGELYASIGHAINNFAYKTIEQKFGFTG